MNIRDIARLAGVGVSTVSRVINEHPDVKDETREKILKIIKESNYLTIVLGFLRKIIQIT